MPSAIVVEFSEVDPHEFPLRSRRHGVVVQCCHGNRRVRRNRYQLAVKSSPANFRAGFRISEENSA